ncbi:MAG: iron-sulfur cluster assembly protein [Promethearchaeota archaeon]
MVELNEDSVLNSLKQVKHPMINFSLLDLGILKDVNVKATKISFTFAWPFPNIPIKDQLQNSVLQKLSKFNAEIEKKETQMSTEELQKFLELEKQGWNK